jgi:hypothetical protein
MWTRMWKSISADIVSSLFGLGAGMSRYNATNPEISSLRRDPVMYYLLQGKWTGTVTPKLLLQAGFSLNKEDFNVLYQPGIQKPVFFARMVCQRVANRRGAPHPQRRGVHEQLQHI